MQILLLELKIIRCSGLQILSHCFVRINAYSVEFQLSPEIFNFSEPAKLGYRRAFNSLKHKKKSIQNFTMSGPTDQNAYCSDICNT